MKKVTLFFLMMTVITFGQQLPLDFSVASHNFNGFDGSTFTQQTDPDDSNNKVGEFTNNGSNTGQGFYIDLATNIDLSVERSLALSFYSYDANVHSIKLKLEGGGSDPDKEVDQNTQGSIGWQNDIVFDFGTNTGTYSRLTIFIDFGSNTSGKYLIDNINYTSSTGNPHPIDVVYDVLVWSDEFDTDGAPNASKWHHQTDGPNGGGWFNGEEQHYTARTDNSFVSNGQLHIVAKKENYTDNGVTRNYTSARLNSKYAFRYGRVDVRAKLPSGDGTWPAIWTLGKNISEQGAYWQTQGYGTTSWPACGEIDIMEHGLHATNVVSSAIHTPSSFGSTVNTATYSLADVANDFHVYSMNWSPNQITFLIDGVGYYTYNPASKNDSTWPFDLEQFLLLNVAMGGNGGTIDPNFTQSSLVIDYVRVYQNSDILSTNGYSEKNEVRMYPNPTTNFVNVTSNVAISRLEMYNVLGKKIHQLNTNSNTLNLDVSAFAKGVYILKFKVNSGTVIKKLIVR